MALLVSFPFMKQIISLSSLLQAQDAPLFLLHRPLNTISHTLSLSCASILMAKYIFPLLDFTLFAATSLSQNLKQKHILGSFLFQSIPFQKVFTLLPFNASLNFLHYGLVSMMNRIKYFSRKIKLSSLSFTLWWCHTYSRPSLNASW